MNFIEKQKKKIEEKSKHGCGILIDGSYDTCGFSAYLCKSCKLDINELIKTNKEWCDEMVDNIEDFEYLSSAFESIVKKKTTVLKVFKQWLEEKEKGL